MDLYLIIGIVAVGLLIFAIALVMLNRAWGDFPGRVSGLPPAMPPAASGRPLAPPAGDALPASAELPAGAPPGGLVPVTHPLVRQAVLTAMERGGTPYALYFIKDGDMLYLVPSRIADARQRENVTRLFASINSGDSNISFGDAIRAMQEMVRK